MLDENALAVLKTGKNLLAFSGGVDSTALFFLLVCEDIPFDIAHVNYRTREQSEREADYARSLAAQHGKRCYIRDAQPIGRNFEAEARRIRYDYFASVIAEQGYENLLTAHQLDDRLEWLLMQLCKGSGLSEMLGMATISEREDFVLVRPLLGTAKADLRAWLVREKIPFFEDASNQDERFLRNRFRHRYAEPLLQTYRSGIEKSLQYLTEDAQALQPAPPEIDGAVLMLRPSVNRLELMRTVDRWLKAQGCLMRQGERERLKEENELVIGRRFALSVTPRCVILTPASDAVMPKSFKEQCRTLGIGPGVRPYLSTDPASFEAVKSRLLAWRREA
jgi:tRNA(Ile)-lysidine synthase